MANITVKGKARQQLLKKNSKKISTEVIACISVEGFHCWDKAPSAVEFLRSRHRHLFVVRVGCKVQHLDREQEIFMLQWRLQDWFKEQFGAPCEFGTLSCEQIATMVLNEFAERSAVWCEVLEDGLGGARVMR